MEYVGGGMKVDEMCVGEVFGFMRLKVGKEHTHSHYHNHNQRCTHTHTHSNIIYIRHLEVFI
jgi:hypothetical protein